MSNFLWKSLLLATAILGTASVSVPSALSASKTAKVSKPQAAQTKAPNANWVALASSPAKLELSKLVEKVIPTQVSVTPKAQLVAGELESLPQVDVTPMQVLEGTSSTPAASSTSPKSQDNDMEQETEDDPMSQVNSVSQLRDVQPTDWAFQALQSLVERYGCIAGYPNGTYRGNRALTRYEFAAGLNACLDRVNELITSGTSDLVRKEDIVILRRLQQDFATELTALRGRVDNLEARTAQVEANQFSTTTKLVGEAVFAITDLFHGPGQNNAVFQDRVRLIFDTSFTGKDLLFTRLSIGNATRLNLGTAIPGGATGPFATYQGEGTQTFNFSPNTSNSVGLDDLVYFFPLFGKSQGYIAAVGGVHADYASTNNPLFDGGDSGHGALSVFATRNPIYRQGGGAGGGLQLSLGRDGLLKYSTLSLGYLADKGTSPATGNGLFNSDYTALGQLDFNFKDRFAIAATYVHGYYGVGSGIFNGGGPGSSKVPFQGSSGTAQANDPSILLAGGLDQRPTVTNSYGAEVALQPSKEISISGWVDKTSARILGRGDADIWTYAVGIAFPDLGTQGSILGFLGGVEPTLRGLHAAGAPAKFARDNAYHLEAFYKYQLTDNISITPGVIWLLAPGQNANNPSDVIGTFRTTFTF